MIEGLAAQARLEAYQVEMLASVETVKSMGAIERTSQRWGDLYVSSLNRAVARGMLDSTFESLLSVLRFGGPISLMLVGAHQVLQRRAVARRDAQPVGARAPASSSRSRTWSRPRCG